jgi:amino acid adenylation domain-containing protein
MTITGVYGVTPTQRGMLASADSGRAFLSHLVVTLRGELDPACFEQAWREVVRRHPVLRTGFVQDDEQGFYQFVHDGAPFAVARLDGPDMVEQRIDADRAAGFSLNSPPLMRIACSAPAGNAATLLWCHHHAILDGWSLQLLLAEALEIYAALRADSLPNLLPAPGFDAYLRWLGGRDQAAGQGFWAERLAGFGEPLAFARRSASPTAGFRAQTLLLSEGAAPAAALAAAARQLRLTPAVLLHALWALSLAHLFDRDDVLLGTTRSGRPAGLRDSDRIAGPFIVTLPLALRVEREARLADWLRALAETLAGMDEHAWVDPARIQAVSAVPAGRLLFETVLVVQNYASGTAQLSGGGLDVDLTDLRIEGGEGHYPLLLSASVADELHLRFRFDLDRLDAGEASRAADCLRSLIGLLPSMLDAPVGRMLAALPADARGRWRSPDAAARPWQAPVGEMEELVAGIWSELVARPVGRGEDFFDSAHSLVALELSARLSRATGRRVPLKLVYERRTVSAIAATLAELPAGDAPAASTLVPAPEAGHEPFPLTELQRAYWIGRDDSIELGGRPSFAALEIRLDPQVDPDRLEAAWARLRRRHPMLRAVITPDGRQRIAPEGGGTGFLRRDATTCPGAGEEVREALREIVADVHRGPLIAIGLVREEGGHRMFVAYDPIVCDAGSLAILTDELAVLARDPDTALPDIPVGFRDYVLAYGELRDGPDGDRARAYWRARVDTLPPPPDLPTMPGREGRERFTRRSMRLDAAQWRAVKAACTRHELTPTALLIAIFGLVIAEWARTRLFCLNLTLFNRQPLHADVARLVGDFTSLTLLETDLREARSIEAAAAIVQAQLLADLDNRLVDGVEVLRWLSARAGGRPATMPVVFTSTLGQGGPEGGGPPPLGEVVAGYGQTPQVHLDCQVKELDGELLCWWDCLDSLFPPGMLDEMFAAFERGVAAAASGPEAMRQDLSFVPDATLAVRAAINATAREVPATTLHGLFVAQARRTPAAPAIVAPRRRLSYAELDRASHRLAQTIRLVAGPDAPVAILTPCAAEQAVASLAALRAGRAFVRLAPDWPQARREAVLDLAGVSLLLTGEEDAAPSLPTIVCCHPIRIDVSPDGEPPAGAEADVADDLAYVIYTSGSTGTPKGVAISHGAAVNTILDVNHKLGVSAEDRILAVSAATFDLSIYDLFGILAAGGAAVAMDSAERADPARWLDVMRAERVTLWNSTPALGQMLVDQLSMERDAAVPPLRAAMLSGDWIPVDLAGRMRACWPDIRVIGMGGATEAAIWSVWHDIEEPLADWPSIPYGAPLANQTVHVLDADLRHRPDWAIGDLYIGGAGLADGYYRSPQLTAAAFLKHPRTGERLYRTGDLARYRPGGGLEFLGREDGQVKIRGYRIELGEVEIHLARQPGVARAVAIAANHAIRAFAVADKGARLDPDAIRQRLVEVLPAYAVPSGIEIVDTIPLTAHGKVDTAALSRSAGAGRSAPAKAADEALVGALLRIAGEVLERDGLGADEDLFLAGADSVSATQIAARLFAATGVRIDLASIFANRSVRGIAAAVGSAPTAAAEPIVPVPDGLELVRASSMQHRLWLLDQLEPGNPRYVIPGAIALRGQLSIPALRGAVADLFARHEPLRTMLRRRGSRLCQQVGPSPDDPLEVLDAGKGTDAPEASFAAFAARPFALDRELPARFRLVREGEDRFTLQFAIHHAAVDAWSIGVLAEDLANLYAARLGSAPAPDPLPICYADFAEWEQARHAAGRLASAEAWWRVALRNLPPQRFARIDPAEAEPVVLPISLDADTTARLRACALRTGVSLFSVLLGIFAAVLRRHGAPDDVAVASSVNGRIRAELERLVGCFVNLVLIRTRVEDGLGLDETARRVGAATLGALQHQDLPFEMIQTAARRSGEQEENPFAAVFVLQNSPAGRIALDGLELEVPELETGLSRYPLHLHLTERHGTLAGALRGERAPLSRERMAAMAADFMRLAAAAAADPDRGLVELLGDPGELNARDRHQARLAALMRGSTAKRAH